MTDTLGELAAAPVDLSALALFAGPGEMRARARALDWAATALGPVATWPATLHGAVRLILDASGAMSLYAGPDFVMLYNDAYRSLLGARHPEALGRPAADVWAELWSEFGPQFQLVREEGEAIALQDVAFTLTGPDGAPETRWYDCALSPVREGTTNGGDPEVVAVFNVVTDTTARVRTERAMAVDRERLRSLVLLMPVPMALHLGPEHRYELVNEAYESTAGRRGLQGQTPREAFPEFATSGFFELMDQAYLTGEPWIGPENHVPLRTPEGGTRDLWTMVRLEPVRDAGGRVVGLLNVSVDITEQVLARRELEELLTGSERVRAEVEANAARTVGLQAATTSLAAATSFEAVARAVDGAARTLGAAGALLYRLGEARLGEDPAVLYGALLEDGGAFGPDAAPTVPLSANAAIAETVRTGAPVFHGTREARAEKYPHLMALSISTRFGAWATVPLVVEGQAVGSLTLAWRDPRPGGFAEADRALAVALADQCGVSVERVRLHAAERAALERAEAAATALRVAEARLRFAMDVAEVGAWDLDLSGSGSWRALRHDQIFGHPEGRAEWTYDDFLAHVHPDDRPWVDERFGGAVARSGTWDFTCRIHRANDGAERWIAARGEVVTSAHGRPERMVGVVRDVTDQQLAEHRLREARDAAESANRAKSEFLAIMSHELRTPLNAIDGYAELMELGIRGPVTDEQRQDLARIRKSEKHLLGLINGVLNYAQVEAGAVHYEFEAVPVEDILVTCEALTVPQVRARGLTLVRHPCDPSIVVRADREKLQQIVLNLLSNAIKFTEAGGRIDVRWVLTRDDRGPTVEIRVADTGIGIAASQLTRVFDPFVQVDSQLTRTREGTGLGLAISRDLARGMGGNLTAESMIGDGSTFTLTLPAG